MSKSEFISAADKVCLKVRKELDPLSDRADKRARSIASAPTEAVQKRRVLALVRALDQFGTVFSDGNDELKALGTPAEPGAVGAYLALRGDYAANVEAKSAAYEEFTKAKSTSSRNKANKEIEASLDEGNRITKELRRSAKAYGFKVCSRK